MVKEAEENAEADKKKREAVDTRNHADSLINETEKYCWSYRFQLKTMQIRYLNNAVKLRQNVT